MDKQTLTTREILEIIKPMINANNDSQLARHFLIDRQKIYQYSQKKQPDISTILLTFALQRIQHLEENEQQKKPDHSTK